MKPFPDRDLIHHLRRAIRPRCHRGFRKIVWTAFCLPFAITPAIGATASNIGYVPVSGENSVYVIDTATQTVLQKINDVGEHPTVLRILPDHSKIYVDNFGPLNDQISVIDTATNTVTKKISTEGLPYASMTLSHDGRYLYVPTAQSLVQVIDTQTDTVIGSFALPESPIGSEISPDDQTLYVFFATGTVAAFDATTGSLTRAQMSTQGIGPDWGAITTDGGKLYAMNLLSDNIAVIDTKTWSVTKTLSTGIGSAPVSGTLTPDGSQLYVCDIGTRNISIINTSSDEIIKTISTANAPVVVSFSPDGKRAYLSDLGKASFAYTPPFAGVAIGLSFFTFSPGLPGNIVTYDTGSDLPIGHSVSTGTGPIVGAYY